MTIVMWIRVHPYKATQFENRKSIFHLTLRNKIGRDDNEKIDIEGVNKILYQYWNDTLIFVDIS